MLYLDPEIIDDKPFDNVLVQNEDIPMPANFIIRELIGVSQGFGRVDAYIVVTLALLLRGESVAKDEILVYTDSLWGAYVEKFANPWYWQWYDYIRGLFLMYYGNDIIPATCSIPSNLATRIDGSIFFGDVPLGESMSTSLTVVNPSDKEAYIVLTPMRYRVAEVRNYTVTMSIPAGFTRARYRIILTQNDIPQDTRLIYAVASIPFSRSDLENDYTAFVRQGMG